MDHFPDHAQSRSVARQKHAISFGHESLADVTGRPIGVDGAALVEKIFHGLVAGQYDRGPGTQHQRIHRSVLLRPLLELLVDVLFGHLICICDSSGSNAMRWTQCGGFRAVVLSEVQVADPLVVVRQRELG